MGLTGVNWRSSCVTNSSLKHVSFDLEKALSGFISASLALGIFRFGSGYNFSVGNHPADKMLADLDYNVNHVRPPKGKDVGILFAVIYLACLMGFILPS